MVSPMPVRQPLMPVRNLVDPLARVYSKLIESTLKVENQFPRIFKSFTSTDRKIGKLSPIKLLLFYEINIIPSHGYISPDNSIALRKPHTETYFRSLPLLLFYIMKITRMGPSSAAYPQNVLSPLLI